MFGNRNLFNFSASKTYQIDMSKKLKSKSSKEKEAPLKQVTCQCFSVFEYIKQCQ